MFDGSFDGPGVGLRVMRVAGASSGFLCSVGMSFNNTWLSVAFWLDRVSFKATIWGRILCHRPPFVA